MLINRTNLSDTFVGFKTIFNDAFNTAESEYQRVAMDVPSATSEEDYKWMGKTTRFRKWLGDRVIQNLSAHSYVIKNEPFENTVGVDRDDIEDDKLGVYKPMIQQLGYDAKTHPDELIFPLLSNGFGTLCYDGQNFFDTDHPVLEADGSTVSVSNMQTGSQTPWFLLDTSKPIRPFLFQKRRDYDFVAMDTPDDEAVFSRKEFRYGVDCRVAAGYGLWQMAFGSKLELNETNLAAALAAMRSIKGDQGKPLNIKPTLLVVPPSLEYTARKLLQAEQIGGTTNVLRNAAELLSTAWLA
ncbi:Mu-like prophage major head subunit gpT family protein [uncultured Rhodospira sp.]|uniref:Mu-like prophage major head subunit gpT family protein n=1 Tax=uncultured Rhodospira sp. TaxID=1936189 RepID=UPI002620F855|nr:Mu-like prophage major head subunit gpT family protein [uncultured Rhodospira sp.]